MKLIDRYVRRWQRNRNLRQASLRPVHEAQRQAELHRQRAYRRLITWLHRPVRKALRALGRALHLKRRTERQLGKAAKRPVRKIARPLRRLKTRARLRCLALGSPAALVTVAIVLFGWRGVPGRTELAQRYNSAAEKALVGGDLDGSLRWGRRAEALGERSDRGQYHLAAAAWGLGHLAFSDELMRRLGPDEHPGFAPAHLFRVDQMVRCDGPRARNSPLAKQVAHAYAADPTSERARIMAAELHASREALVPAMGAVAGSRTPGARLLHAELQLRHGLIVGLTEADAGASLRSSAVTTLLSLSRALRTSAPRQRTRYEALAAAAAGRYAEAMERLEVKGRPGLKRERANMLVTWSDHSLAQGPAGRSLRLSQLSSALTLDPACDRALLRVCGPARLLGGPRAGARVALLALAAATPPSPVVLAVMVEKLRDGDAAGATASLTEGLRRHPRLRASAVRLAWILADRAEAPQVGLALANLLCALPRLRGTGLAVRGRIALMLGQLEQARRDLAAAPETPETLAALAACHAALGNAGARDRAWNAAMQLIAPWLRARPLAATTRTTVRARR